MEWIVKPSQWSNNIAMPTMFDDNVLRMKNWLSWLDEIWILPRFHGFFSSTCKINALHV